MNKTLLLSLLLALLIGTIAFFAWKKSAKAKELDNYEGTFAIENVDDIGKIILSHRAGNVYILTRDGDGWKINESYPARMSSVTPLLDALRMVQIRYIPSDKAIGNVMENIDGTWIHAEIFHRNGEKIKSYRVGGVTQDERGTYMIMDGSKQPFVVHIPSWDGALRTRYTLELPDWRDRRFMDLNADDITSVKVEYPQQKSQSFALERRGSGFALAPVYPELRDYPKTYRDGTGEIFLRALAEAACEGYENQYPLKDSIRGLTPFCQMQIRRKDGKQPVEVRIWPKGAPVYTANSPPVHRLFVERTPGDFVLVQFDVIKGMLRGYDFFTGSESNLVF
ncbi:MAG TPA: DUF4340 domain-containing protein [Saprospiraceae bacterium]|nr:DUF4340 domain-containing protein [Saprospiraceae bacterium]